MFLRKYWYWLLLLSVVIGISGFILLKHKPPTTATKVFKAPDLNQIRKNASNNVDKPTTEQDVKENTETQIEESTVSNEEFTEIPAESPTDGMPLGDENVATSETETEDWRANDYGESIFGFGPYPEIPSDFPESHRPIWTYGIIDYAEIVAQLPEELQESRRVRELMTRLRIKLWNKGRTDITSISLDPTTNKVYPLTANTVVVGYIGTGPERRIFSVVADANFPQNLINQIRNGEKPPGIQIIDADKGGFNIYEYLGL